MTLSEIAEKLCLPFKGDPQKKVDQIKDIERVHSPEMLRPNSIYYIENQITLKRHPFTEDQMSVLVPESLSERFQNAIIAPKASIRLSFIRLLGLFSRSPTFRPQKEGSEQSFIHESAKVSPSAMILPQAVVMQDVVIDDKAVIYPNVTVEPGARVGKHTRLYPGVVVGYNCVIGDHCIIYSGSVIGADGFGYHDHEGERYKIPQISHVEVHDHVEIGANSSIDRGTIEPTIIGRHTKIDNLVQIGHNCQLGEYIFIAGNAGVSGSVKIGDRAMLGGKVGIADHINIGEGSMLLAGSGLHFDTKPKTAYLGLPARVAKEAYRINGAIPHLPGLLKRVRELEAKVYGKSDVP